MRALLTAIVVTLLLAPSALPRQALAEGTWTIRISTSGGFTGQGRGSLTLTSAGSLTCILPGRGCGTNLTPMAVLTFTQVLASADPSKWSDVAVNTVWCSDCFTTSVVLERVDGGKLQVLRFVWNDVSRGSVPAEVLRLTEMAFSAAVASSKDRR